ncbi:MAG: hypothetical protein OK457_04835, partial [Thaumarchaeota archaeon]|nr:hypothetical protein [Nitrososphaerota archaeon]
QDMMNCSKASALEPLAEAEDLRSSINSLKVMLSRGKKPSATSVAGFTRSLREKLDYYEALGRVLEAGTKNRKLLLEFQPAIEKLRKLSLLGVKCIEYLEGIAKDAELFANPPKALLDEVNATAKMVKEDSTQVLGQLDFGWRPGEKEGEGKRTEYMDDMGLPKFYSESPIMELYEFITSKWGAA